MFLDAPVAGSTGPAKTGALVFLCSGDEAAYKANKAAIEAMSKSSYFFGNAGQGTKVKLVVNMMMGTVMSAYAEGLALAEAAGLPGYAIQEVILRINAYCFYISCFVVLFVYLLA